MGLRTGKLAAGKGPGWGVGLRFRTAKALGLWHRLKPCMARKGPVGDVWVVVGWRGRVGEGMGA